MISFSFVVSGNAINNSQHQLQQTFKPFTEYWIAQCYNGNAQVNEIIPVVNGYDEVTGYSISFRQDTKPAGYVILDLNDLEDNNPIAEYTLSGEDWYTVMSRAISKSSSTHKTKTLSTHEKKLRSNTYTDFSIDVQTSEGEKVLTSAGKLETKATYIKTAQSSIYQTNIKN